MHLFNVISPSDELNIWNKEIRYSYTTGEAALQFLLVHLGKSVKKYSITNTQDFVQMYKHKQQHK